MKRTLVIVATLVAVAAGLYWYSRPRAHTLQLTGTVDGNEVVVGSQITGRIVKLTVNDGQAVEAGDLIATLDQNVQSADAKAAAAAFAQAQADTRQSEAQAQLLTATLEAKLEQARAQQAQAEAQLSQARAQAAQTQAAWEKAHANYGRIVPLAAKGVSSPQELDNAKADQDAARASHAAALAGVTAAQRAVSAAQANVAEAEQQQRQVGIQRQHTAALSAAALQAQASHQAALARLGQTEVRAPVSGIVTLRAAREGEVVTPGSPIVTIFQLSDTWVDAAVPETYAPLIRMGETLQVKLPDGEIVTGPVIYKAVLADFATQRDVSQSKRDIKTVALRIRLGNAQGQLPLGMTAWVLLPVPAHPDAVARQPSRAGAPGSPVRLSVSGSRGTAARGPAPIHAALAPVNGKHG